jgi:ubiquinone/menaquinone biosynthesis C-methylase UbiE
MKRILDVCCGGRAFWFDKTNGDVEFCDIRNDGEILLCNGQTINVSPDTVCDFTSLPFENEQYYLVVFDPPHLIGKKETAWMVKKYGSLPADGWQDILQKGFKECMRVLKPNGVLIFKWNEVEIPLRQIIEIFGKQPLFGHPSGKRMGTHWCAFMKDAVQE